MLVNSAIRPRWDPDSQGCSGHFVPGSSALWSCGALPESPVNLAIASFLFSLITSVPREHTWVHTVLLPTHLSLFSAQIWLSSPQCRILTCSFHKLFDLADLRPCLSPLSSRVSNCPVRWGLQQHFLPGSVLVCENLEDYCFLLSGVSSFWWSQFMWACAILQYILATWPAQFDLLPLLPKMPYNPLKSSSSLWSILNKSIKSV